MYAPLSGALNLGLEGLSKIEVDGLPKFQDHIVFIPLDEGVTFDRVLEGSSFKPGVALMLFTTACAFCNVKGTRHLKVSEFIDKIPGRGSHNNSPRNSPKAAPSYHIGWKDILSAVAVKRDPDVRWPTPGNFTDTIVPIIDDGSDMQLLQSRTPSPETSDVSQSQSQTRKIHALVGGVYH